MSSSFLKYIPPFFGYLLLQVLVFNKIDFLGAFNPFLYILFIITLPVDTKKTAVLFIALLMGFGVDVFSGTLGLHSSACLFLAFSRNYTLRYMSPREGFEFGAVPGISEMGILWFVSYAGILTFLHHLFLFVLEIFRFSELGSTLVRTIVSSVLTLVLMLIFQYLFSFRRQAA